MYTDVQIINQGLSKFSQSKIQTISPPRSSLERHMADGYEQWKRSEIAKHRWVFAWVFDYQLAQIDTLTDTDKPYVYSLPVWCMRPVRAQGADWRQTGRTVVSAYENLAIDIIKNVDENEFDPLFVDVLACRIGMESVEFVTQSNAKDQKMEERYDRAVAVAKQNNAFVIGPEPYHETDEAYPYITARYI